MADEVRIQGLTIAASVIEKVVEMAADSVDSIAGVVLASPVSGFMSSVLGKEPQPFATVSEDGSSLMLSVHVSVYYGHKLTEVADTLRQVIADAVAVQVGVSVSQIDIYIDNITFQE